MNIKVYQRDIDAGHGFQTLVFVNGKCVAQRIAPKQYGRYTGDGNPEFIGQTPRQIGMKRNRFSRVTSEDGIEGEYLLYVDTLTR